MGLPFCLSSPHPHISSCLWGQPCLLYQHDVCLEVFGGGGGNVFTTFVWKPGR